MSHFQILPVENDSFVDEYTLSSGWILGFNMYIFSFLFIVYGVGYKGVAVRG